MNDDQTHYHINISRDDATQARREIQAAGRSTPFCRRCAIDDGVLQEMTPGLTITITQSDRTTNDYRRWTCRRCNRTLLDSDTDPTHT